MSLLRAALRFFSDLTEATSATASDWLAIQKSGESEIKKIKPTNLPYLASSHAAGSITGFGTTAANLGTSAAGSAATVSRSDHVHKMPSAADVGAAATAHTHGSLTSDGKLGTTADLPVKTTSGGAIAAGAWGSTAGTFCQGNDARLSDARAPTTHTHGSYDNSTALTGANVYSQVTVDDGIVTGLSSRALAASDVGALSSSGGTVAGDIALSATSGQRAINIGTGRTGDGNAVIQFYAAAQTGGADVLCADILRIGGTASGLRIRQHFDDEIRLQASVLRMRNRVDDAYVAIEASAFTVSSDPRNKRDIREPAVPSARALSDAAIEFEWSRQPGRHIGFDARKIRDIAPLASVEMVDHPETGDRELGVDLCAIIAIQARHIAELADRVEALESARLAPGQQPRH